MVYCDTCSKYLPGSWKVENLNTTGGRLGVNGYFLSYMEPNRMDVYCRSCWETAVLNLPFVEKQIARLTAELTSSQEQLKESNKRESELKEQLITLGTENASLQQELNKFNTAEVQNLKNLLQQLDKEQLVMLQNTGEFNIEEFHCKQITEQHKVANESVKEATEQLKIGVEKVIQDQLRTVTKRKTTMEQCIELMTSTETSKEVIDSNQAAFQKNVEEESNNLQKWKKFKSDLEEEKRINYDRHEPSTQKDFDEMKNM